MTTAPKTTAAPATTDALDAAQVQAVLALGRQRRRATDIACDLNLPLRRVRDILRSAGSLVRGSVKRGPEGGSAAARGAQLVADGASYGEAALEAGCTRQAIHAHVKRHGKPAPTAPATDAT